MTDHPAEGKPLLPCPFCGKPPKYEVYSDGELHSISCPHKGCVVADVCEDTFKEAQKRWNTRHSQGGKALADAIAVIRAESCPFREGPMADGWAEAWATFLNRLGDEDGLNNLYANSTAHSPSGKASMTSANLAALIHEARFPEGKDAPNYIPFLHEDRSGREYCLRIARKIIETVELAAAAPSPAESSTRLIEIIEALIVSAEQNTDDDGNIYPHAARAIADARKFYREGA